MADIEVINEMFWFDVVSETGNEHMRVWLKQDEKTGKNLFRVYNRNTKEEITISEEFAKYFANNVVGMYLL